MKHRNIILSSLFCLALVACAHLQPGADPIVVRAEQTQRIAKDSFQLVLTLDNNDRGLWRSNAPAFHAFCEWLRQPMEYPGAGAVPRDVVMLLQFDDIKQAYKSSRGTSNALDEAIITLTGFVTQANAWATIVTNQGYRIKR